MKIFKFSLPLLLLSTRFISCENPPSSAEEESPAEVRSPVTVTHPETGALQESVTVQAVSAFLLRTTVKANANGYLQMSQARQGRWVNRGEALFAIETKEARSLGNTVNRIDSSLHFEGLTRIKAPGSGYISQLNFQPGDYVQDGDALAVITDANSFVFLLDLPYELTPYLPRNRSLELLLPDSTRLPGQVTAALPTVDSVSQTQRYIIRVNHSKSLPENLIAQVKLIKQVRPHALSLPKAAVLSDEVQSQFWIMKMSNDSTAVKVPVQKGLETGDRVEILSPPLSDSDRILLTGNYGLPDTARVVIMK